jgi:hypothetical protein
VTKAGPFCRLQLVSVALLFAIPVPQHAVDDVGAIVQRWTEANRRNFEQAQRYGYLERIRTDAGTKVYAMTMLLGSPYKQLIENDGESLKDAQQRMHAEVLERERREAESPDDHRDRIDSYQKNRRRAHRILEEMPRAFEYTLRSTRRTSSRTVYVLSATPRENYDPPNIEAQVLTGMQGEFWIDTQTYQLFYGSATVLRPVSIEGFLATVEPGTEFEVEQRPVGDGIWLPTHFSIRSRSRIVFLFHHHRSEDRTYFDYHKVSTP